MVGSPTSQPPPGTSHRLGKLRSVAARWTMRRRGFGVVVVVGVVDGDEDDDGDDGANMKLLTTRLVYCLFWARKGERGMAR